MGRASKQIAIFLILLTAASNLLIGSGIAAALDIAPSTQGQEAVDQATANASEIEPSQGGSETLFGIFTSGTTALVGTFQIIFAAPRMFIFLGVPGWLTTFFFAPMVVIVAADTYHLLSGRDP
jgi:hypothetical protein